MKALRFFLIGAVIGFILNGCASIGGFTYKRYGLDAVSYDGTLLGPKPADDLTFKVCEPDKPDPAHPTVPVKGKCVVMLRDEFYRMKGDFLMLEKNLIDCQQGAKP